MDEKWGTLLRLARIRAGLTQAQLAFLAHIKQGRVSAIETHKALPDVGELDALLRLCGCEIGVRDIDNEREV